MLIPISTVSYTTHVLGHDGESVVIFIIIDEADNAFAVRSALPVSQVILREVDNGSQPGRNC